jgi:hypothetical protein
MLVRVVRVVAINELLGLCQHVNQMFIQFSAIIILF